jgi:hypothetical protein
MLRIPKRQVDAISLGATCDFEERAGAHLRRFFPRRCAALGPGGVRALVRAGIERAAAHGVHAERDVCKYIDLMAMLGRDFEDDPALPWARRILEDPSAIGAAARVDALYDAALRHVEGGQDP